MRYTARLRIAVLCFLGFFVYQCIVIDRRRQEKSYDFLSLAKLDLPSAIHSENFSELTAFYHWENACLFPIGPTEWIIKVRLKGNQNPEHQTNASQIIYVNAFQGESYEIHSLNVTFQNEEISLDQTSNIRRIPGTYFLTSHHTPNNNFHLHNNLLLPVFRIHRKAKINGILLFQGCTACWENRMEIMSHILEGAMKLNVLYSLEQATTTSRGICVDRLILSPTDDFPFYQHQGRFSLSWPPDIFSEYRDLVQGYFRSHASNWSFVNTTTAGKASSAGQSITMNNTKPILSWISRGTGESCVNRCIKNEREVQRELSRLFQVHMLHFEGHSPEGPIMTSIIESDILIGLHGAGLAYTSLLKKGAIVVELKSAYGKEKMLFLNMAASLNISYFAVNLENIGLDVGGMDVHLLPKEFLRNLAKDLYAAYKLERDFHRKGNSQLISGECNFPTAVVPFGTLSSYNQSRCYLREYYNFGEWWQCDSFDCY
jgi:hypothetical protein